MFGAKHYVPILKGKEGEFSALRDLAELARQYLTPLIEIPPVPHGIGLDDPGLSVEAHLTKATHKLAVAWGPYAHLFVDLGGLGDADSLGSGAHPLSHVFCLLRDCRIQAIPVAPLFASPALHRAIAETATRDRRGACLRLRPADILCGDFDSALDAFREDAGLRWRNVDLIVDLGAIGAEEASETATVAEHLIELIPSVNSWRSLTVAASAFPPDLSGLTRDEISAIPRAEWAAWRRVTGKRHRLPRLPAFADYAIAHPAVPTLNPRTMRLSANIRYTVPGHWLVARGRDVKQHGWGQTRELCKALVGRPEYVGASFSKGDQYIEECAFGTRGPGNATVWRAVGTSHHLTLVTREVAKLTGL